MDEKEANAIVAEEVAAMLREAREKIVRYMYRRAAEVVSPRDRRCILTLADEIAKEDDRNA